MSFKPLQRERPGRRRFWAPEIVQTSAMDCGPAALKCVLEGFGVKVSWGRLREACQTSVDGTSTDTLEKVAASLGLEATQLMLPVEHAVAAPARMLPAIAVVRIPSGPTHFVVLWRRLGPYLQVMDPARGRRWVRAAAFLRDLHVHTQPIDVASFRKLVADPTFTAILAARLAALGGGDCDHQSLIAAAIAEESWLAIARLDGAIRAMETMIGAGLLSRGEKAQRVCRALAAKPSSVAEDHACVTRADAGPGRDERVLLRGAVLIHLARRAPRT
jgi:ATP-binding cassette subfamily B protein